MSRAPLDGACKSPVNQLNSGQRSFPVRGFVGSCTDGFRARAKLPRRQDSPGDRGFPWHRPRRRRSTGRGGGRCGGHRAGPGWSNSGRCRAAGRGSAGGGLRAARAAWPTRPISIAAPPSPCGSSGGHSGQQRRHERALRSADGCRSRRVAAGVRGECGGGAAAGAARLAGLDARARRGRGQHLHRGHPRSGPAGRRLRHEQGGTAASHASARRRTRPNGTGERRLTGSRTY